MNKFQNFKRNMREGQKFSILEDENNRRLLQAVDKNQQIYLNELRIENLNK